MWSHRAMPTFTNFVFNLSARRFPIKEIGREMLRLLQLELGRPRVIVLFSDALPSLSLLFPCLQYIVILCHQNLHFLSAGEWWMSHYFCECDLLRFQAQKSSCFEPLYFCQSTLYDQILLQRTLCSSLSCNLFFIVFDFAFSCYQLQI